MNNMFCRCPYCGVELALTPGFLVLDSENRDSMVECPECGSTFDVDDALETSFYDDTLTHCDGERR